MQRTKLVSLFLIISFLFIPLTIMAQDVNVTKLIGKKLDSAVSKLGKPSHQDRSNKEMECVFYKSKTHQIILVANKSGIYQAEGMKCYNSKKSALKFLDQVLKESLESGCTVDTVNSSEYNIDKTGAESNIIILENSSSKKFEVRIKANSRES
jgi:hypothetical protein